MSRIRQEISKRKIELRRKCKAKITHLEQDRAKEIMEKLLERLIPVELEDFSVCKVLIRENCRKCNP